MIFLTYLGGTLSSMLSGRLAKHLGQPLCMVLGILILLGGTLVTLSASLPWIVAV